MKEKISRKQQAENTKKKLLEVSIKLIKEYGFDAVTMQQICSEANVSTGAFYHHLKSKAGIIVEGYSRCDEYFEHVVSQKLSQYPTVYEKIIKYIGYQMEYTEYMGVDLMIQIYKAQITESNNFFLSNDRGLVKGLLQLIQEAQKNNELVNDVSYEEIGRELLIIARGIIYNWCQSGGDYSICQVGDRIIKRYLYTYKIQNGSL